jgi:hypothetical protein
LNGLTAVRVQSKTDKSVNLYKKTSLYGCDNFLSRHGYPHGITNTRTGIYGWLVGKESTAGVRFQKRFLFGGSASISPVS